MDDESKPRRRPKPANGMSTRAIALIVGGVAFAIAALLGGGAWVAWKMGEQKRATQEELQAEREADRLEAAAAFANPVPPTPDERAEFGRFFDELSAALKRGDATEAGRRFDSHRMTAELTRQGAFDRIPGGDQRGFRRGFAEGVGRALGASLVGNELLRWDRTTIRRVRWTEDRKEAVVIAVHADGVGPDSLRMKMRWWFIRKDDGWKIYDLEDLEMGMRISQAMRMLLASQSLQDLVNNAPAMRVATHDIRSAMVALVIQKDFDEAERILVRCRGVRLPDFLAAVRELVEGGLLLERNKPEDALRHLIEADRLLPGMPVVKLCRAAGLNQLEKHAEALELAQAYMAELGPDAVALAHAGFALEGLGRHDEALDSYRKGSDEDPDERLCLLGLLRLLPVEMKSEIADRLTKSSKPMEHFEELLRQARVEGDDAGVKALIGWLRTAKPDDPRVRTEELRQLVKEKQFEPAAAKLKKHLAEVKGEERRELLNAYLFAMIGQEKHIEAYQAVPAEHAAAAFHTLAGQLEEDAEDADPEKPSTTDKKLGELIAAHRKRDAADPWLWYFEGSRLQARGEFEKAEREFSEGGKKLAGRPVDPDEPDAAVDSFRSRRVACFLSLKQGLKAYTSVGPSEATFRQIASHFDLEKDATNLAALLALHRKENPASPELAFWEAEVDYLNMKYERAAAGFLAYHSNAGDKAWESYRAVDHCIRSWVRTNRVADARRAIAQFGDKTVPASLRADVEALAGDLDALERILGEAAEGGGNLGQFYYDEDFVRLTAGAKFAGLRMKYPDPRPKAPPGKAG